MYQNLIGVGLMKTGGIYRCRGGLELFKIYVFRVQGLKGRSWYGASGHRKGDEESSIFQFAAECFFVYGYEVEMSGGSEYRVPRA